MTQELKRRNARLWRYHQAHPEVSLEKLAERYGISRPRIGKLLKEIQERKMANLFLGVAKQVSTETDR